MLVCVQSSRAEDETASSTPYQRAFDLLRLDEMGEVGADPDPEDVSEAMALLRQQADAGHSGAANLLGMISRNAWYGQPEDPTLAIRWFRKAIAMDDPSSRGAATMNLANTLISQTVFGGESWREVETLGRSLLNDELLGSAAASLVGQAILLGPDSEGRLPEAEPFLIRGLGAVPVDGQTRWLLARGYDDGWFGERDANKACDMFLAAAQDEDMRAYWYTGMCYLNGTGVPVDEAAAFRWVKAGAQAGDQQSMISLAVMYGLGQGTDVSPAKAANWYDLAIRHGGSYTAHALRSLGVMHLTHEFGDGSNERFGYTLLVLAMQDDELARQYIDQIGPITESQRADVEQEKLRVIDLYGLDENP
jgi:TPR repeat protein